MKEDKPRITEESRSKIIEDIKRTLSGVRIDDTRSILKSMFQYIENIQNATTL